MAKKEKSFYQRLNRLFRSGPAVRRKIKGQDYKNFYDNQVVQNNLGYYGAAGFKREASPFSVMGAYGVLDRMSRYAEFAEMENCLHGDTKIAVPGGYKTLKELVAEYGSEKEFVVYSYDHEKSAIIPAVARMARHTTTTHAYRVKFDNGKEIIGTEDHRLMKRDGAYCEIRQLKTGDAMMPFYRRSLVGRKTGPELQENCYQIIYTMNKNDSPSRWISEHRLLGKFIAGRNLEEIEVVHHKNFKAHDNRLENLELMTKEEHQALHSKTLNGKKWDKDSNSEWIEKFKKQHSSWMKLNNPAERKDISFEKILQWCDKNSYHLRAVAHAFNTDKNTIKRKLKTKGFDSFTLFAKTYCTNWKPYNGENKGSDNNRYRGDITFETICNAYTKGMSQRNLANKLKSSVIPINARIKEHGFTNWSEFTSTYHNLKIESVEYYGITELYDITVDGYKNFATDSLIAHNSADIATALNVYADESCATDENGKTFHIYSDNHQVQRALEELFYEVMNIEFNARRMVRNLVKNGDYFMYVEVVPDYGIINVEPLPVNEVEREEGFDKHDPYAVRFRLITRGGKYLENWQMLHFRILGNDLFLPYGTSFLESARRPWRQLVMMEDSMLMYRLVRSPERRVFYVDVSAVHPNDIPSYMEAVKESMRGASVIEQQTGRQDFRYNPLPVHKDSPIPLLDGRTITIENLAKEYTEGKQNWVYSIQDKTHQIVPGKVVWCGKNYTAEKLIKVWLDDDSYVVTAPEHPFILRDGTSKRADELEPGQALMPLYTKLSNIKDGCRKDNYPMVYDPCSEKYKLVHRIVASDVLKEQRLVADKETNWETNKYLVVHHKDCNKNNNAPENLLWIGNVEHSKHHAEIGKDRLIKYNKSEKKRLQTIAYNREHKLAQKMAAAYNGTELHKQHNVIRRQGQLNSWATNRTSRMAAMRIQISDTCLFVAENAFKDNPQRISRDKVSEFLFSIPSFVVAFKEANLNSKRANKIPNSRTLAEILSESAGFENYSTYQKSFSGYQNHKVSKVEIISDTVDVYCMTVVGPNGEDDRHNFATNSLKISTDGTAKIAKSAILLKNSIEDDYFLPTRPNNQTKIESLPGGANATAIEDVEFIHKKLVAALMVPKAYLTYDEAISSKATLAQEDIRFSRTVGQLQKILISELNKLAMIHLYALGFSGDDLLNFDLKFSNPSTVAVQQKLALISSKLEIAAKALELSKETGLLSFNYIQKEIIGLRTEQINVIKQEARQDQVAMAELKKLIENPPFDKSIDSNIDIFDKSNYEVPTSPFAPDKKEVRKLEQQNHEQEREYQAKRAKEREEKSGSSNSLPIKFSPTPNLDKSFRNARRSKTFTGDRALVMPDFKKMLDITSNRYSKDPYDMNSMRKFVLEESEMKSDLFGKHGRLPRGVSKELATSLLRLNEALYPERLVEAVEVESDKKNSNGDEDELLLIEKDLKTE